MVTPKVRCCKDPLNLGNTPLEPCGPWRVGMGSGCRSAGPGCWDNAMAESFFATLKNELIYRRPWPTPAKAREAVIGWIAGRYNRRRRHSALGMQTPLEFEKTARHTAAQAA